MLGRHLLGYMPVQAAQALVGFGGIAVLTRLLPPDQYGRYALALAAMHVSQMVLFTWLDAAVARFHARADRRGGLGAHLASAYAAWLAMAVIAVVLGGVALVLAPLAADMKAALGFALAAMVVRGALQIGMETRRAAGDVARYSMIESLNITLGFALGIGFILATPLGAAGPFAGMALGSAVALLLDLPAHLRRAGKSAPRMKRAGVYLAYGLPISISLMFEHLLSVGDRFLIAAFLDESAVGLYAAGYGLADRTLNIIFVWLGAAAAPLTVAALERGGVKAARTIALRTAGMMGLVAFPASVGLALVAAPLAGVLVGEDFREGAAAIAPWIAVSGLMNGLMTYYFHEAFTLRRRTGMMAAVMAGSAALNLGLNLLLIPWFGLVGAAAATVGAYAVALTISIVLGRRLFPLPVPLLDWGKAALAAAIMGLGVWAIPGDGPPLLVLLMKAGAGAAIYVALALALDIAGCRAWMRDARLALKPAETPS